MKNASDAAQAEWEAICRRCGQCCFEKWIGLDGTIRFTRVPCRHLDIVTRACRVYAKRLEVGEGCVRLTSENLRDLPWLPADCAYVKQCGEEAFVTGRPEGRKRKGWRSHDRRAG